MLKINAAIMMICMSIFLYADFNSAQASGTYTPPPPLPNDFSEELDEDDEEETKEERIISRRLL